MKTKLSLRQRLLRIPLFYKILLANSAIVGLGAVAGTVITVWHVRRYPDDIHYELIIFFAIAGMAISFFVNRWTLRRALEPLERLQEAVNQVRQGQTDVQVTLGSVSDEQFDRLAETFNRMVLKHERHTEQMQQLSRQILQAQEDERQRLARELHDEAAQALTSLLVHLRLLERAHEPEKAQQNIQKLRELTAQALEEVRRVALDLRPTILDDLGLGAALEWRVDEFTQATGVQAKIQIEGLERRLPREIELVFYRVGQEALNNIARHAQAKHVSISLRRANSTISLEVSDDGLGFNPTSLPTYTPRGLGLLGMRERLAMISGALTIESGLGQGTRVLACAPLKNDKNGVTHV
ncbi:MAG: HAMP domain-containing protein [Anaerolineae bacterium]|nr:HAMP domain-containing protein [Anaerolineae bacterium]